MSEQNKRDAELRQIVTDALVSMVSGVTGLVPPTGPGQIPDFIQEPIDRVVEKISASLPAGVPDALREAVEYLDDNPFNEIGAGSILHRAMRDALAAAPTVKAEQAEPAIDYKRKFECLAEHAKRQDKVIADMRYDENIRRFYDDGAVWFWVGDETDNLETLACPVVINAGDLRALVAQQSTQDVNVPRELLQDLRDLASDAVDHHRQAFAGYKLERQARMDQVIANADALLNGGEA